MNMLVYLGLSTLSISKALMYEFCDNCINRKYQDAKLYYMDTDSFIINIKTEGFYEDIAAGIKKRFDTSNYKVNRPLPTRKNKKVLGLMKDGLGGKIMQDVYKNIAKYNLGRKCKVLLVFDDMIADMISNKKLNPVVPELFIRGRKLNISIVFITQSYFKVPKDVRINYTYFFIIKIPNKREIQQITINHSSDVDFKDFMKIYKKCTEKPYSFLVNDTNLRSDNPLRFRKNLLN